MAGAYGVPGTYGATTVDGAPLQVGRPARMAPAVRAAMLAGWTGGGRGRSVLRKRSGDRPL
jgi:hypothetical protein